MKKVLLMVVDALATRVIEPALQAGDLPNLRRLIDAGAMRGNCVPVFPSITPAATCGIVTGRYPRDNAVMGAYFYDTDEDRVYYYGDDFWVVLEEGIGKFFDDFLKRLNFELLDCETLFERVEDAGLHSACINYLWFRGKVKHAVNTPSLLSWLPGVDSSHEIGGPEILCLGDFVTTEPKQMKKTLDGKGGPFHRFGFDDASTTGYLTELVEKTSLPDLTLAYFPDNDYRSHEVGPQEAVTTLHAFDATLGRLIEIWGSVEQMLEDVAVIITGDHSQTDMQKDSQKASVNLDDVLKDFDLVPAGKKWTNGDELMVCPNMRAAQIYLRRGYWPQREKIVHQLLSDPRIDQAIWRCGPQDAEQTTYHVATSDRGTLRFWAAGKDEPTVVDAYGGRWAWEGDLQCVDGQIDDRRQISFGDYPNAFERIATSFRPDVGGDLWVTAHPGYEFHTPRTATHPGGSHGALHLGDSEVPLIFAGLPDHITVPAQPRAVDVAPICLDILEVASPLRTGASHMSIERE